MSTTHVKPLVPKYLSEDNLIHGKSYLAHGKTSAVTLPGDASALLEVAVNPDNVGNRAYQAMQPAQDRISKNTRLGCNSAMLIRACDACEDANIIPLTRGYFTMVDKTDLSLVSTINWHVHASKRGYYARGKLKGGKSVYLHRYIMEVSDPTTEVDHVNGDCLDNRRHNLRVVSRSGNNRNRTKRLAGSSIYKGVRFMPRNRKWAARLCVGTRGNVTEHHLGSFLSETEAALAYDAAARCLFGEYGRFNFPVGTELSAIGGGAGNAR